MRIDGLIELMLVMSLSTSLENSITVKIKHFHMISHMQFQYIGMCFYDKINIINNGGNIYFRHFYEVFYHSDPTLLDKQL